MGHRQFYAAAASMLTWAKKLTEGDVFKDYVGMHYTVTVNIPAQNMITLVREDNGETPPVVSKWTHEDFCKMSLDRKLERICKNCKRTRKEHLKKAKCLFGATSWA